MNALIEPSEITAPAGTSHHFIDSSDPIGRKPIGTFDVRHETGEAVWSPGLKAIFGLPVGALSSWDDFWPILHRDDRKPVLAAIMRSLESAGPRCFSVEHRIVRPDGSVRWVHAVARTFFTEDGPFCHPIRTVGTVYDRTVGKSCEGRPRIADSQLAEVAL
jgi:PAS domain-containing protein